MLGRPVADELFGGIADGVDGAQAAGRRSLDDDRAEGEGGGHPVSGRARDALALGEAGD